MDVYTTSDLVHEYRTSLNAISGHSIIVLQWIRGHETCNGNIIADNFCGLPHAKKESSYS